MIGRSSFSHTEGFLLPWKRLTHFLAPVTQAHPSLYLYHPLINTQLTHFITQLYHRQYQHLHVPSLNSLSRIGTSAPDEGLWTVLSLATRAVSGPYVHTYSSHDSNWRFKPSVGNFRGWGGEGLKHVYCQVMLQSEGVTEERQRFVVLCVIVVGWPCVLL